MLKTLQTLIKLHRRALDEKRQAMVQLETKREALAQEHQQLEDSIYKEGALIAHNPDVQFSYPSFMYGVRTKQEELHMGMVSYDIEIEALRQQIQENFEELKKYEVMQEQKILELSQKEKQLEQTMLDEVGTIAFNRKEE